MVSMFFFVLLRGLKTITLYSVSHKLLARILENPSVLSFGSYFFVFLCLLYLCTCFTVLDKTAMLPNLGGFFICLFVVSFFHIRCKYNQVIFC